jgi:hypothetical protein
MEPRLVWPYGLFFCNGSKGIFLFFFWKFVFSLFIHIFFIGLWYSVHDDSNTFGKKI